MLNFLLVSCGIMLLIYSIVLCFKINKKITNNKIKKAHSFVIVFIYLFIIGYITFLLSLVKKIDISNFDKLLVSTIFFLGALFVLIVSKINLVLTVDITEHSTKSDQQNKELKKKNEELEKISKALQKSKNKFKKHTIELDKTLEDFYTMRLNMENGDNAIIKEENKKLKESLDKIRNKE